METFRRILVTGGAGFIGSHFIRLALRRWPQTQLVNLDLLTYAGNPANLLDCAADPRYRFVRGDVRKRDDALAAIEGCDAVVHFAAESHVDRSILASDAFITTNFVGTHVLLEAARSAGVRRFLFVGTDEVYGSLPEPRVADESHPLEPNSPYSVTKAAADMLVRGYFVTYGLPTIVTRTCNNFGPHQYPEKLVSLFVTNLLDGRPVPLYGDGLNVRDWIYVADNCLAVARVLEDGRVGEAYNISAGQPSTNRQIAEKLLNLTGRDESFLQYVKDRPGHDRRYAIDASKLMRELGFKPQHTFDEALRATVAWYRDHRDWWQPLTSGEYRKYYERQYGALVAAGAPADR